MKKLVVFSIFSLLFLTIFINVSSADFFTKCKKACEDWCSNNKQYCSFCDKGDNCAKGYFMLKSWKHRCRNYVACGSEESFQKAVNQQVAKQQKAGDQGNVSYSKKAPCPKDRWPIVTWPYHDQFRYACWLIIPKKKK
jgi:hypothetical protein